MNLLWNQMQEDIGSMGKFIDVCMNAGITPGGWL